MLSSTDPVAVVALLKEAGAPTEVRTVIEGESLLNDASAFVIFEVPCTPVSLGPSPHARVVPLVQCVVPPGYPVWYP